MTPSVIDGLREGVNEMSKRETFQGYPPYEGFEFVREKMAQIDFKDRGINIDKDEFYLNWCAKRILPIFKSYFRTI